jgi:threonine dehydrogenase-like Zn-dependent dehydrogenase
MKTNKLARTMFAALQAAPPKKEVGSRHGARSGISRPESDWNRAAFGPAAWSREAVIRVTLTTICETDLHILRFS